MRKRNCLFTLFNTYKRFRAGPAGLFPMRISTFLSLFQQQSFLFVILTLPMVLTAWRSTRHHGWLCLLVAVQLLPLQLGLEFPSLPLEATPPQGPVVDCLLGLPLATLARRIILILTTITLRIIIITILRIIGTIRKFTVRIIRLFTLRIIELSHWEYLE